MGIGRGEAMPVTQLEPPPTFPPIENQVLAPSSAYLPSFYGLYSKVFQPAKLDEIEGEILVASEKRY